MKKKKKEVTREERKKVLNDHLLFLLFKSKDVNSKISNVSKKAYFIYRTTQKQIKNHMYNQ
jgi:hypothetical protein